MTDLDGNFDFRETLKHGVYEIYSRKEKDGYPDLSLSFYRPSELQAYDRSTHWGTSINQH